LSSKRSFAKITQNLPPIIIVARRNGKKKIAFIASSLTAGGAERNALNLAIKLSKHYKAEVISLRNINDYKSELGKSLKSTKIKYLVGPSTPSLIAFPIVFFKLFRIIEKEKYSLLIGSHEYTTYYITVVLAKLFGIKSLLIVGNNLEEDIKRKGLSQYIHNLLCKISFTLCDKIVCVSKGLTLATCKAFNISGKKVEVIYNGVDVALVRKKSKEYLSFGAAGPIISILGRLSQKKGHSSLIAALKLMKKKLPDLKLIIIGKGSLEYKIFEQINVLDLARDVVFTGFIEDNPYKYLKHSGVFVFPSLYEGFGNVIVEAMASGVPVVAYDAPFGPSEILRRTSSRKKLRKIEFAQFGVLVPPQSRKFLAEAVVKLLKSKKLLAYYRKAGIKRAKDFSLDKMVKHHDQMIANLLKNA
jgi:glycosyltransferase involved in cell wall biosynthesis